MYVLYLEQRDQDNHQAGSLQEDNLLEDSHREVDTHEMAEGRPHKVAEGRTLVAEGRTPVAEGRPPVVDNHEPHEQRELTLEQCLKKVPCQIHYYHFHLPSLKQRADSTKPEFVD